VRAEIRWARNRVLQRQQNGISVFRVCALRAAAKAGASRMRSKSHKRLVLIHRLGPASGIVFATARAERYSRAASSDVEKHGIVSQPRNLNMDFLIQPKIGRACRFTMKLDKLLVHHVRSFDVIVRRQRAACSPATPSSATMMSNMLVISARSIGVINGVRCDRQLDQAFGRLS